MSDLKIWKAILQINFPSSASLFDNRGKIATTWQHKHGLTEWRVAQNQVDVHNKALTRALVVNHRSISAIEELPESYDEFSQLAGDYSSSTLNVLGVRKIERAGLRLMFVAERKNFRSLVNKMKKGFYKLDDEAWGFLGGDPADVGLHLVLNLGDGRANLSLGPMEKIELERQFESEEAKKAIPEVSLLADIDFFYREPKWHPKSYRKQIGLFLEDGKNEVQEMVNRFVDHFGGFQ